MKHEYVRRIADKLLGMTGEADTDGLAAELALVVSVDPAEDLPLAVVRELVVACANSVATRSSPLGAEDVFTVFLHDTGGRAVSIDDLEPGIRAALRAVVADLNGDPVARDLEIRLAVSGAPLEVLRVIAHCVRWGFDLAQPDSPPALSCGLPD